MTRSPGDCVRHSRGTRLPLGMLELRDVVKDEHDAVGPEWRSMTQPTSGANAIDRRMALAREWDELIAQVRELDGFEDFLKPPRLETLLPAAERGPVVIVNMSRWRCDALIVRPDGVTTRQLPTLTMDEAANRAAGYLAVLRAGELADLRHLEAQQPVPGETSRGAIRRQLDAGRAVEEAHQQVDEMLADLQAWMWDVIAEPVLDELSCSTTPDGDVSMWPRVWWCPTGPLTVLPLHTAGRHSDHADGCTVLDRVVSSYTPTLRALLEARRPDREQDATDRDLDRLLLVDVPDLPGLATIDNAAERAALLEAFPEDRRTVLDTAQATPEAVRAALPDYRWVHFSCHGDQDLKDPSHGGLLLRDGVLTARPRSAGWTYSTRQSPWRRRSTTPATATSSPPCGRWTTKPPLRSSATYTGPSLRMDDWNQTERLWRYMRWSAECETDGRTGPTSGHPLLTLARDLRRHTKEIGCPIRA
jgi:hypothetical protein